MSITTLIDEGALEFERRTGRKPTILYLGRGDRDALFIFTLDMPMVKYGPNETAPNRSTYRGWPIFVVDSDRHVGFSV